MAGSRVAILAGGAGSRLKARSGNVPKPMVPVLGRPVLEHLVRLCCRYGFEDIALLVHHQHEVIRDHFGDGSAFGARISYCVEGSARGTAGALSDAATSLADTVLVLYGDTYAEVDLAALWRFHHEADASATLVLHPNDHPHDSDIVEVDDQQDVLAIHGYPHPATVRYPNLVNAAMYVIRTPSLRGHVPETGSFDLAKHVFPALLQAGVRLRGYRTPEYIKDMGTSDRLDKVERDVGLGLPDMLSASGERPAIFLDRDGTLNREVGHLRDPSSIELIAGAAQAVRQVNRSGYLAVVVTNQPVVARGEVTREGLRAIHGELEYQLGVDGAYLDEILHCPHHPDRGFPGEVPELKFACDCRKPETGMIDSAVRRLRISRSLSWIIGDSTADVLAGARAGLRTILVRTGAAGGDGKHAANPDYVMPDVGAAVRWALDGHRELAQRCAPAALSALQSRLLLVGGLARAGKSCVAQVLAEQLRTAGRIVHVISMDGWIKPAASRIAGETVHGRYQLDVVASKLAAVAASPVRQWLEVPTYDRNARASGPSRRLSIGPQDVMIVEGVPALLDPELAALAAVRVFVSVPYQERQERLLSDYAWRTGASVALADLLAERELDEVPFVLEGQGRASHVIVSGSQP